MSYNYNNNMSSNNEITFGDKLMVAILAIIVVIYLVVLTVVQDQGFRRHLAQQQAYEENTVLLADGHRVNRDDYEAAHEAARQEELERLGLDG